MTKEQRLMLAKIREILDPAILKCGREIAHGYQKKDIHYISCHGGTLAILHTLHSLLEVCVHDETSEERPELIQEIRDIIAGKKITADLSLRTQRLLNETLPAEAAQL